MSQSNTSSYLYAIQQITIYMGIPILIAGVIGEILNCIVFLSLQTFRENTCAFYLIVMSFVNIGQLLTSLLPRIVINGFHIDWTQGSLAYCKNSATIDQYLATCFNPRLQQLSNIKLARILCLIFLVIWLLHGIPYLIDLNIVLSPTTNALACSFTNPILLQYFNYGFLVTLAGFWPFLVTISFGFLAYRNVTQLAYRTVPLIRRELDKQLSIMVLVEVIFNCFATIPYIIVYILQRIPAITSDPLRSAKLSLASSVLILMYYLHYATPFYIYIGVSERFRRQLIYVLVDIHLNRWCRRVLPTNQVSP